MSERGEIEVLMPLLRQPTKAEQRDLKRQAFTSATQLASQAGGKVLGLLKVARAVSVTGDEALRFTFAALAPEQVWHRRRSFTTS